MAQRMAQQMARQSTQHTSQVPDAATVRTALQLAMRAPSVHNSQPWHWRVLAGGTHHQVQLWSDDRRRLPHTDPDGRDLVLSCGTALHHAVVAFAALGWRATVHRLPEPDQPRLLAVLEICRCPIEHVEVMLAAAIPRRRTDRRPYSGWPVAPGDLALMGARAARAGVTVRQLDSPTSVEALRAILTEATRLHVADDAYLDELTRWSGRFRADSGVPARNTPPPDQRAALPGRLFAGPGLAQVPLDEDERDHSVLLALGTAADDRLAWLRAGEATSVVLLTATALGLASCPVTEPLEIAATREAVRAAEFGDGGHPQMLLRVGWAPINADPLPPTPRRRLADTVDWVGAPTPPAAEPTTAAPFPPLAGSVR